MTMSFTARQAFMSLTFSMLRSSLRLGVLVHGDRRDAIRGRRVGGQPAKSLSRRLAVARRAVEVVVQLLERGELLLELGRDEDGHMLLTVFGRHVPLDAGEHDHVGTRGPRLVDRVEVFGRRRLEIQIGMVGNRDRVAPEHGRPVEDAVDGPGAV